MESYLLGGWCSRSVQLYLDSVSHICNGVDANMLHALDIRVFVVKITAKQYNTIKIPFSVERRHSFLPFVSIFLCDLFVHFLCSHSPLVWNMLLAFTRCTHSPPLSLVWSCFSPCTCVLLAICLGVFLLLFLLFLFFFCHSFLIFIRFILLCAKQRTIHLITLGENRQSRIECDVTLFRVHLFAGVR